MENNNPDSVDTCVKKNNQESQSDDKGKEVGDNEESKMELHPLLLPEILCLMFNWLNIRQIWRLRMVNRNWNLAAVTTLRNKWRPIHVKSAEHLYILDNVIKQSSKFPVSEFDLELGEGGRGMVTEFIPFLAEWATKLGIFSRMSPYPSLQTPIPELILKEGVQFSALKYLDIYEWSTSPGEKLAYLNLILKILQNSPNLEQLDITEGFQPIVENILSQLSLRDNNTKLKCLRIDGRIEDSMFTRLGVLNLKLRSFRLYNRPKLSLNEEMLMAFLTSQSETLVQFELKSELTTTNENVLTLLPRMNKLESLEVSSVKFLKSIEIMEFVQMQTVQTFPRLKKLSLLEWSFDVESEIKKLDFIILVQELWLPDSIVGIIDPRIFVKFRSLSKLKIPYRQYLINVIYICNPGLRELSIATTGNDCIDSALTGFTVKECEDLGGLPEPVLKQLCFTDDSSEHEYSQPISSLTELTTLRLKYYDYQMTNKLELTKVSFYLALSKMPSLKRVDFVGRNKQVYEENHELLEKFEERFELLQSADFK